MKAKFLLLSALAMVALNSCNKNLPKPDPDENIPAVLEIRLAGSDVSKATGTPVEATETSITKGVVFVFRGTGADPAIDAKVTFDFTSASVTPIRVNITQGIRQVYVVSNINTADFMNINNLSDLQHIANKLTLSAFRANGPLPMSGFVNNVNTVGSTTTTPLAVNVPLNFIGSRVHVDWDLTNLNASITGLVIDGAAILNTNAFSEYIATPNGSGGYNPLTHNMYDFLQGIGSVTGFTGSHLPSVGMAVPTTNAHDAALFVPAANKGFANNYTYMFENGSQKPVIVTIKGTYNSQVYYWPIVINGALNGIGGSNAGDMSASVKRATIYKVKAVIKALGVEDPYAPINPGVIDVTIIPASWLATINIDQEFN